MRHNESGATFCCPGSCLIHSGVRNWSSRILEQWYHNIPAIPAGQKLHFAVIHDLSYGPHTPKIRSPVKALVKQPKIPIRRKFSMAYKESEVCLFVATRQARPGNESVHCSCSDPCSCQCARRLLSCLKHRSLRRKATNL